MSKLTDFITVKDFVTDRISTQVRIIAIGLLATTWSLLIQQTNIWPDILQYSRIHFIGISIFAIITLVFDYLQYIFSYLNINKKIKKMRYEKRDEADYDYDIYYKLSVFFFYSKQLILLVGAIYFIDRMFIIILS